MAEVRTPPGGPSVTTSAPFDPRHGLGSLRLPGPGPWRPDPHLEVLLDPDRLSALVGAPVRATRVRPKPGVKHVAALVDHQSGMPVGWVQVLVGASRVKLEKARLVAAEVGLAGQVHDVELPGDALLVWGPVASDTRLARALAGLDLTTATVLRYNPMRRLVLRVGDTVVRVTEERHRSRWDRAVQVLAAHGVPTLRPADREQARATGLRRGGRVSVWRWVEGRDLLAGGSRDELRAAGRLLRELHDIPLQDLPGLGRRGWPEVRAAAEASVRSLEEVAPWAAAAARAVLEELPSARGEGPDVLLHGDFSLDQCLLGSDGRVVLGDLDRLGAGPAEVDLASMWAVALIEDSPVGAVQAAHGAPAPHPCWIAAALLSRVAEPWRAQDEDWPAEVRRRSALAATVLEDGLPKGDMGIPSVRTGVTTTSTGRTVATGPQAPLAGWQVPATLQTHGEVVEVRRAWPVGERPRVAFEGPDSQHRLRAGTLDQDGAVRLLPPGEDPKLPSLGGLTGRLVVHRAGRRAVVQQADRYVKVLRPGRAPGVADASRTGGELVRRVGLAAPEVIGGDGSVIELSVLPGTPVHQLSDDSAWAQIWPTWAGAWERLQQLEVDLERHTFADEAQVLRTWASRAAATGVLRGTPWPARLARTAQELHRTPVGPLVVTHRDLHDQQLLWDGARLGVLDLDTLCLATPELDPVNLLVHAHLRMAQGLWAPAAVPPVQEAVARVLAAADVPSARQALAERATVARLAAVYAYRPAWREPVLTWAEHQWARLTG